jgi:hypothetical protein
MTQLNNNIYVNGEWPRDFVEVTIIVLKKPKATKCSSDHRKSASSYMQKR